MSLPFILLLVGILLVVGGIIWLRLHAFLALTLTALAVGLLTPSLLLERHYLEEKGKTAEQAGACREERRFPGGGGLRTNQRQDRHSHCHGRNHRKLYLMESGGALRVSCVPSSI